MIVEGKSGWKCIYLFRRLMYKIRLSLILILSLILSLILILID